MGFAVDAEFLHGVREIQITEHGAEYPSIAAKFQLQVCQLTVLLLAGGVDDDTQVAVFGEHAGLIGGPIELAFA